MTAFLQWVASKPLGRVLIGATIGLPIGYGIGSLAFNPYFQRWWADHWPLLVIAVPAYLLYPLYSEWLKGLIETRVILSLFERRREP